MTGWGGTACTSTSTWTRPGAAGTTTGSESSGRRTTSSGTASTAQVRANEGSRGGAAYLYLISILIWPQFDTYPYISIQNILTRAQNILITKIYL